MTARDSDDDPDVRAVLSDVLDGPETAETALPALLSALDVSDRATRLQAALGICLVADATPVTVEPLTWRLVDRLADDAENLETRHALAYLRQRYPERVRTVLLRIADAAAQREERRRHARISRGFAHEDYYGRADTNLDVGNTRLPADGSGDPRRIYQERGEGFDAPRDDSGADDDDPLDAVIGEADEENEDGEPGEAARRRAQVERLERAAAAVGLDEIAEVSRFDELHLVAPPTAGRYTTVYRTRAVIADQENGIALRTFTVPDEHGDAFVADVWGALEAWATIAEHELIATIYDWHEYPQLWMATAYADETLADRPDLPYDDGLRHGLQLGEAVAHAHERGVVHSGIDPYNVVFSGTTMDDRPVPRLTNVGLLDAIRSYVEPSEYLDPRYAAPEYFDRKYGRVDHATDIYHLGAVLYYLVTGRAPYRGSYEEVRQGVLAGQRPAATDVNPELPAWVDDVVAKAMARQKLTRYESATQFVADLRQQLGDDT